MDLSVIIVTFNSSPHIEGCLGSVFGHLEDLDHEVIVVDNGSEDETCGIIEERFPEAVLIRNGFNAGFARANNLALRRARGEFVLLVNPDTAWKKGEVKEAIRFMKDHPGAGALGCRLLLEDGSRQKSNGNFPTLTRELKETFGLSRLFPQSPWMKGVYLYEDSMYPRSVDWVSGTFFLSDRRLLAEIGFFDERYFMYYEDIDLSRRIRDRRREVYYYPRIEVVHHQKWPVTIDFGESPYIYFTTYFGSHVAEMLRYILVLKSLLRLVVFFPLVLIGGKRVYREKLLSNYLTLRFHLFQASRITKRLRVER